MIHTAGRFVTETELRTYTKCSQLHFYGGELETPPVLALAKYAFEALTSHSVRKDILDPLHLMQKYLYRACRELGYDDIYMDNQVLGLRRQATTLLGDVFNLFSFETYIPVFGPLHYNTKLHKTPVTLNISGLYRSTKNQTLHIVCFSPYPNDHAMVNDPTVQLKLQTLKRVVKAHYSGRPQAKLHIFGVSPAENNLLYSSRESGDINPKALTQITNLVKQLETDHHHALVPCPYQCPFKKKCFPENT